MSWNWNAATLIRNKGCPHGPKQVLHWRSMNTLRITVQRIVRIRRKSVDSHSLLFTCEHGGLSFEFSNARLGFLRSEYGAPQVIWNRRKDEILHCIGSHRVNQDGQMRRFLHNVQRKSDHHRLVEHFFHVFDETRDRTRSGDLIHFELQWRGIVRRIQPLRLPLHALL